MQRKALILTEAVKLRRLRWLYVQYTANAVFCMLTVFGAVFMLFMDELGLPKSKIGLLLSFFPFCGLLAPFVVSFTARFGFKRTYLLFFGMRKVATACLLLTPWVLERYKVQGAFLYVAGCILVFSICRSISETAVYPWTQELVPNRVRGRFNAVNTALSSLAMAVAMGTAAWFVHAFEGLYPYMILLSIGVVFGFVSVWAASHSPGGKPRPRKPGPNRHWAGYLSALQDKSFLFYLGGVGMVVLGLGSTAFMTLYMKEKVGLSSSMIMLISMAVLPVSAAVTYFWGWIIDRFGSRPVMLFCLFCSAFVTLGWVLVPREAGMMSLAGVLAINFMSGVVLPGYTLADSRILMVSMVPEERNTNYLSLYYAWLGFCGGIAPLVAGKLLDASRSISGELGFIAINAYSPLILLAALSFIGGALLFREIKTDTSMSLGEFIALFMRGNAFTAAQSLMRYRRSKDEHQRLSVTQQMGEAKSPLTTRELLADLNDPSYSVRLEAIIAVARMASDPGVTKALSDMLASGDLELRSVTAWALGRRGDPDAIPALRACLDSSHPILQSAAARALAALEDTTSGPLLAERFIQERDARLRLAYAAALGGLQVESMAPSLLEFLYELESNQSRREVALALARMLDAESQFIQLCRDADMHPGTRYANEIMNLQSYMVRLAGPDEEAAGVLDPCINAFGSHQMDEGARLLSMFARRIPLHGHHRALAQIWEECALRLGEAASARQEYILLAFICLRMHKEAKPAESGYSASL